MFIIKDILNNDYPFYAVTCIREKYDDNTNQPTGETYLEDFFAVDMEDARTFNTYEEAIECRDTIATRTGNSVKLEIVEI